MRASALGMTSLLGNYVHADRNILAEIGFIGQNSRVPSKRTSSSIHKQVYPQEARELPRTNGLVGATTTDERKVQ